MNPASFSVIIPAFRAAATLPRALASVRESLAFARARGLVAGCEAVVADDASPDELAAVALAEDSLDLPVRLVRHATNQGAGMARNSAIAAAAHDLLCFLDADDYYLPEHLAVCAKAFATRPGIDYAATCFQTSRPVDPSWIPVISGSSVLPVCIRRAAHDRLGGFPSIPCFEDVFYRRLADRVLSGWRLANPTVVYVWRPGNSFDAQLEKFQRPVQDYQAGAEDLPDPRVTEAFRRRLAAIAQAQ
ncbi:MAG: glycosyltransferase family 2 protein [Rhodospirillales bacterium]|nr:glycosyltransferase family 2 protein [Rhodospirillales bacterium]